MVWATSRPWLYEGNFASLRTFQNYGSARFHHQTTVPMDALEPFLGIKYKLTKNTNWEEFLEAVGIDVSQIKGGTRISPVVELSRYQDKITLKTVSVFKNHSVTFKLGEEYEDELPDGQKVKAVTHLENNKLIQIIPLQTEEMEIVREFGLQEMLSTYTFGEFVATRKYKKQ